jgi:hypothetical protein
MFCLLFIREYKTPKWTVSTPIFLVRFWAPDVVREINTLTIHPEPVPWPRGLRRRSAAARLLRLWVRIPPGGMDVCCECCVWSGRGLGFGAITRSEEAYRLWCVVVCDLETSRMRRSWPSLGRSATGGGGGRICVHLFSIFQRAQIMRPVR